MKRKFLALLSFVLMIPAIFMLVACKETKEIVMINGFRVESVELFEVVEGNFSIEIGLTNENEESATFYFDNVVVKKGEIEIHHTGENKEYEANQYFKWSFSIDSTSDLAVGDKVDVVYFDEQSGDEITLATVTVSRF